MSLHVFTVSGAFEVGVSIALVSVLGMKAVDEPGWKVLRSIMNISETLRTQRAFRWK
jgi:hypothetical protein